MVPQCLLAVRLPRTRGDRPPPPSACRPGPRAPPHTRGSTSSQMRSASDSRGSPAHAGIDRSATAASIVPSRLPRTRGDRPIAGEAFDRAIVAPPHTRGSTCLSPSPGHSPPGSPAHAGIDPRRDHPHAPAGGLPRTRGDRPPSPAGQGSHPSAPPHTRGSTLQPRFRGPHQKGSPAHAGIDLDMRYWAEKAVGLPRTRGDRPSEIARPARAVRAPPHTRGSTRCSGSCKRCDAGSPAHAGIDLERADRIHHRSGLPRTRGDRPLRLYGEEDTLLAPPHTRGSTCGDRRGAGDGDGSPAHAGIDPDHLPRSSPPWGLPRTRGDRPAR